MLQELDRGTIELAIARIDYLSREKYKIFPIRVDHLVLVCTRQKAEQFVGHAVSLLDVKDEDFVLLDDSDIYTLCMDCFAELGITPHVKYTASRHLYLLSMVSSGLGMCILPKDMVNLKMFPELISIPFKETVATSIGIIRTRDSTVSPFASQLYNYFTDSGLGPIPET